jgi:hypothetical protein
VALVSVVPFVLHWLEPIYLLPLVLMDGAILYSAFRLLTPRTDNPRRFIRWIYLSGLFMTLAFISMRLLLH